MAICQGDWVRTAEKCLHLQDCFACRHHRGRPPGDRINITDQILCDHGPGRVREVQPHQRSEIDVGPVLDSFLPMLVKQVGSVAIDVAVVFP